MKLARLVSIKNDMYEISFKYQNLRISGCDLGTLNETPLFHKSKQRNALLQKYYHFIRVETDFVTFLYSRLN